MELMSSSHAHEAKPMFTDQEKGLLVVVLTFITLAASVAFFVFSTLPDKQWGELANPGPIAGASAAAPKAH
jgi:hypothetical protein